MTKPPAEDEFVRRAVQARVVTGFQVSIFTLEEICLLMHRFNTEVFACVSDMYGLSGARSPDNLENETQPRPFYDDFCLAPSFCLGLRLWPLPGSVASRCFYILLLYVRPNFS